MNHLRYFCSIILISFSLLGCHNKIASPKEPSQITQPSTDRHSTWKKLLDQPSITTSAVYSQDAIKINSQGGILEGRTKIVEDLVAQPMEILTVQSNTVILAHQRRAIEYEIAEYTDANAGSYKQLIIWQTIDSIPKRVFEVEAKVEKAKNVRSELETRRKLWMQLCNQHQVANLVNELYSENTLYYNHRPLIRGRAALIPTYQYMSNESYQLTLNPITIETVNPETVFEIGQCEGSYNGKYILIWKKQTDGQWRIWVDSNI